MGPACSPRPPQTQAAYQHSLSNKQLGANINTGRRGSCLSQPPPPPKIRKVNPKQTAQHTELLGRLLAGEGGEGAAASN